MYCRFKATKSLTTHTGDTASASALLTTFPFLSQTNFRIPSDEEPFRNIIQDFMEDQVFAEQRLAGVNPMSMYRVASNDGTC